MITLVEFRRIEAEVRDAGYGDTITWAETLSPPTSARQFASKAIFVICSSGMRYDTAVHIHDRCMQALRRGKLATTVFSYRRRQDDGDAALHRRLEQLAHQIAVAEAAMPRLGEGRVVRHVAVQPQNHR